eukprot:2924614-Amphidinium_carterae.1
MGRIFRFETTVVEKVLFRSYATQYFGVWMKTITIMENTKCGGTSIGTQKTSVSGRPQIRRKIRRTFCSALSPSRFKIVDHFFRKQSVPEMPQNSSRRCTFSRSPHDPPNRKDEWSHNDSLRKSQI